MFRVMFRIVSLLICLAPTLSAADPINLKLSFFTSDRSQIYQISVKPFVDAVNAEANGLIHIDVYFSGVISDVQALQPQLVSDGTTDLAFIVPSRTPDRFHDSSVLELPGLFPDGLAASRVFTRLIGSGALAGYEDFHVLGAFVSGPEAINSRKEIASIADLQGLTVRVNNPVEADVLQRFGAVPVLLAVNQTAEALSRGLIEAATLPPSMLPEFGVGRVSTNHFMIGLGGAPTALVMNRAKFDGLPMRAQAVIRKYSGDWLSDYSARKFEELDQRVLKDLEADPRRKVVFPSEADEAAIQAVYSRVIGDYDGSSNHHRDLLARVRAELANPRPTE